MKNILCIYSKRLYNIDKYRRKLIPLGEWIDKATDEELNKMSVSFIAEYVVNATYLITNWGMNLDYDNEIDAFNKEKLLIDKRFEKLIPIFIKKKGYRETYDEIRCFYLENNGKLNSVEGTISTSPYNLKDLERMYNGTYTPHYCNLKDESSHKYYDMNKIMIPKERINFIF